jgi:FtsP/CotA-like multicopper oxidase with cupredoxin domain
MNMSYAKKFAVATALLVCGAANAADINLGKCVGSIDKQMSDGKTVTFWGYGPVGGMGGGCSATIPSAPVEVGVGDTLNLTLSINHMTPQEAAPYNGHTIHLHGADVPTSEDGVPETGAAVTGDTYTFTPSSKMYGSYMYHCHVHTVKHLEMGMYGPLIVRPKDPNKAGAYLNQITDLLTTVYAFEKTYLFSTVDPAYHTAVQDDPVFADYNPQYFLINGAEGIHLVNGVENNNIPIPNMNDAVSLSAVTLAAKPSSRVALRLIGLHSVNGTFEIKDASGGAKPFTVYTEDGRALPTPSSGVTSLDISPGQRFDIIFTTPAITGTWYPQITYKKLRVDTTKPASASYATAYGKVTF